LPLKSQGRNGFTVSLWILVVALPGGILGRAFLYIIILLYFCGCKITDAYANCKEKQF
jgi:hypothetical protein